MCHLRWIGEILEFHMWRMSSGDRLDTVDDRRKRKRVAVHWRVRLFHQPGQWVDTTTENISSEGL